jgi:hypothetical protein
MRKNSAVILLLLGSALVSAQEHRLAVGNSLGIILPAGNLQNDYRLGVAFSMHVDYSLKSKINLVAEFGWTNWFWQEDQGAITTNLSDAWSLLAGLRYEMLGPWYLETRTGYYFKTPGRWVLLPATGVRLNRIDLNLSYSILENSRFTVVRMTYFWGD